MNFQKALEEPLPYPGLHMVLQNEYVMPFKASSGQFFGLSLNSLVYLKVEKLDSAHHHSAWDTSIFGND